MTYRLIIMFTLLIGCTNKDTTVTPKPKDLTRDQQRSSFKLKNNKSQSKQKSHTQNLATRSLLEVLEKKIKRDWKINNIKDINTPIASYTPLALAITTGKIGPLKRLLKHPNTDLWKLSGLFSKNTALQNATLSTYQHKQGILPVKLLIEEMQRRKGDARVIKYIMYSGGVLQNPLHEAPNYSSEVACYLLDTLEALGGPQVVVNAILTKSNFKNGDTVLHNAAIAGDLKIVQSIVEKILKVKEPKFLKEVLNQENEKGLTPLFLAASSTKGGIPLMQYMMSYQGDIAYKNNANTNILHCVSKSGDTTKMEFVLKKLESKIGIEATKTYIQQKGRSFFTGTKYSTPIESSLYWQRQSKEFTITLLKKVDTEFDASLDNIRTLLEGAIPYSPDVLAILLLKLYQKGGKEALAKYVTSFNKLGKTPFHTCIYSRNLESTQLLVQHLVQHGQQDVIKRALQLKIKDYPYNKENKTAGLTPLDLLKKSPFFVKLGFLFENEDIIKKSKNKRDKIRQLLEKYQ